MKYGVEIASDGILIHIYSWTRVPTRLHHTSCRQPCGLKVLGLQRGIPYEIFRDHRS
jgi:hypothetical protein